MPTHGSGPMRIATPSLQWTFTTYSLPVSTGAPVRMDFRGPDIGDFVYHCHILGHEDAGMMAIIRVLPRS
jgi:FtsP/CotA-like multicopper oxidase with cupredoxin domain